VNKIFAFIGFQAVWFVSVLSAANESYWPGPATVICWILIYGWKSGALKREITLALLVGAFGFFIDTALIWMEAFMPKGIYGDLRLSPAWMVGLWLNFATSLNSLFLWLKGRYILSAMLGFIGGPAAYYSGAALGAAAIQQPFAESLFMIGLGWGISMPLLILIAEKFRSRCTVIQ
jgi:hypothetical protein